MELSVAVGETEAQEPCLIQPVRGNVGYELSLSVSDYTESPEGWS